jgi:hypothetical protein
MRLLHHAAVLSAFAIIAAIIVFARPHQNATAPIAALPNAQLATFQK